MTDVIDKRAMIRDQNDRLRRGDPGVPGEMFFTSGLAAVIEEAGKSPADVFLAVRQYDSFTADSDPYGEHDFGVFEFCGCKVFWKVDYYDLDLKMGSEDPSDLTKTRRVLTVFLAEEY